MTDAISPLHEALARIGRSHHAHTLNRVVNDPAVFAWVHGDHEGPLDLSEAVANPLNILLMGEHGGILFVCLQPGIYDCHTQVLPAGRGQWTLDMVNAAIFWMFTKSDALELVTRCPEGNIAALALTKRIGGKLWFHREDGWVKDGKVIPADIYRIAITDWMETAPGLIERGNWFRKEAMPHASIATNQYARMVGFAVECIMSSQLGKAVVFYNRYAMIAGVPSLDIMSTEPLALSIGGTIIVVRDEGFYPLTQVAQVNTGVIH